jgi:hypothetical protein
MGLLFHPTTLALSAATISKVAVKPRLLPSPLGRQCFRCGEIGQKHAAAPRPTQWGLLFTRPPRHLKPAAVASLSTDSARRAAHGRRRLSQLDLACNADISARHLSFLETGRSQRSREMVLLLAEQVEVPLRERNILLVAAGYAPVFPERTLDDPALSAARRANRPGAQRT